MATEVTEKALRSAATQHGLYVPSGAFWGGEDIRKMADRGTLQVCNNDNNNCIQKHSSLSLSLSVNENTNDKSNNNDNSNYDDNSNCIERRNS